MTRTGRPAGVTAAAVLLLVVATELLLGGLALTAALIYWVVASGEPPVLLALGFAALLFGVGTDFLVIGVKALRGGLRKPETAGRRVVGFGTLAAALALLLTGCCGCGAVYEGTTLRRLLTTDAVYGVAGLLGLWGNAAVTITAGTLFGRNSDRYFRWQEATRRPREDAEYEPD